MNLRDFDFIIIGSGLAGLVAAFHAASHGTVALLSKSELGVGSSYQAQGGVAAAVGPGDSLTSHLNDTLTAGRGLCDYDAVEILVAEGRERIFELMNMGMKFDCDAEGKFLLGLEGGHSRRRVLHVDGDATGKVMTNFMLQKVLSCENITSFEHTVAIKILEAEGYCTGVHAINLKSEENFLFRAKATVLATGGIARLYSCSTNPCTATGDGVALAWQAGAKVADMEFIQFHPSVLNIPKEEPFLISEAVRGEGAYLLDKNSVRFMKECHPLAELAPRDVVASAVFRKVKETGSSVYLSLRHLNVDSMRLRFRSIDTKLKSLGINMTTDLIPVVPAAHYMMGGVRTDLWGETSMNGLFACGEVASTGVMGANRLASNSLLECLVYGKRVIDKACRLKHKPRCRVDVDEVTGSSQSDSEFLSVKSYLANIMSEKVGIIRDEKHLREAVRDIEEVAKNYLPHKNDYNRMVVSGMANACRLITVSSLARKESRGANVRDDFLVESKSQERHIIQQKGEKIDYESVRKAEDE